MNDDVEHIELDYDPNDWDPEEQEYEDKRRAVVAARQIVSSFKTLCELWGEKKARQGLQWFLDQRKPPVVANGRRIKTGGREHNPLYDQIYQEYNAAEKRGRGEVLKKYAARLSAQPASVLRTIKNMQKCRREIDAQFAEIAGWFEAIPPPEQGEN